MSNTVLSLPSDVRWKRIAISADMYALTLDAFPPNWSSSITVYSFEPDPDPLDSTGEVTTFLKVSATITGLVWAPWSHQNLGGGLELPQPGPSGKFILLNKFFAAFSALVQVAVVPSGTRKDGTPWAALGDYPYFSDFEPKKREVVEPFTSTGEALTVNSPQLTVTKSTTSTPSTESDVAALTTNVTNDNNATNTNTSTSTTKVFGAGTNLTTEITDASRERRETQSFTTSLSHIYQTLNGYHAGTNRAMFLLSPRPHLVDSVYTFVNGPRRLEGIQDFFLVVRRPLEMAGICVKATLNTAHLDIGTPDSYTVFMTARSATGCTIGGIPQIGPSGTWVPWETFTDTPIGDLLTRAGESGPDAVGAANAVGRIVLDEMTKGVSAGTSLPEGVVDIAHTQFGLRHIINALAQTALQVDPHLRATLGPMMSSLERPPSVQRTLRELEARTKFLNSFGILVPGSKIANQPTQRTSATAEGSISPSLRRGTKEQPDDN